MPQLVTPPGKTAPIVEHAIWWAGFHHRVFPLCSPAMGPHTHPKKENGVWVDKPCSEKSWGKIPICKWQDKATKDEGIIRAWFDEHPLANLGGTPDEGYVWIDVDTETPPVQFPNTFQQTTGSEHKHHLLFTVPDGLVIEQTQPGSQYWDGIDTRVAGMGYVVLSPSTHHTGRAYRVINPVVPCEFPAELLPDERVRKERKPRLAGKVAGADTKDKEVVELLKTIVDTPEAPELGNLAFAKIASRLAKMCAGDLPMFRGWLAVTNAAIAEPMDDSELGKLEGIWTKTEEKRLKDIATTLADGERGWLYEMGEPGYSTAVGSGDKLEYVPWSNFRVQAKTLINYGDHHTWVIDIVKADGSVIEDVELPSDVLASTAALRKFMIGYGVAILAPTSDKRGNHGERLMCLLQSQEFERQSVIEKYGWDSDLAAFVTPDSLITADTVTPAVNHLNVRNSRLSYGFDTDAVDALRKFLTFQDELAMSLFGAFLMATILRGHYAWQPPNLAVEAHAGSGKSTYLRMLGQFCGVKREPGLFTPPVARDSYAVSSNIFNWFDDVPMTDFTQSLFRQSGTGGTCELKDGATGFRDNKIVVLHASTVLSAERVTFMEQKAMADRFLMVKMPSADTRLDASGRSQWHEVSAWFHGHKQDLTRFAGTLVQEALKHVGLFGDVESLTTSTSRPGQMVAIMRCGARVLSAILGDDSHTQRVDAWAAKFDFNISPSIVINRVIPTVWAVHRQPYDRHVGEGMFSLNAVFFDETQTRFWVAPTKLARRWADVSKRTTDREAELTDAKAIELELEALGVKLGSKKGQDGKRWMSSDRKTETLTYYPIPLAYTDIIWRAATGHGYGKDDDETS